MNLSSIDYVVLAAFFVGAAGLGVFFSRGSRENAKSYFLGRKNHWWMLAASGASTNFSVNGTVWNLAILMVLGMKSFFVTLVWWMPNAVILMAYSGIWIRRCGGMTAAELNRVRFGVGAGARWARSSFALMITLFSIASLCLSYIVIHKFASIFGCTNSQAHWIAFASVVATSTYVLIGGFRGVVFSEFLQTIVLFSVAVVIGVVCYRHYSAADVSKALTHGSGSEEVTPGYWRSLMPEAMPRVGSFASSSYSGWKDFSGMVLAGSVIGILGCIGGAGGRYGEQRFLATNNSREAAWLAGLWQLLGLPRWVMTAGLCFFAMTLFRNTVAHDPDSAVPLFLKSDLLGPGLLGLVLAGLSASFMTSFCSEINACASIVVRDLFQPILRPSAPDDSKELVMVSYISTAALAAIAIAGGYWMVESQARGGSALNVIWAWMLNGLLACLVAPLALRWYWGRMNGWGFAAGCLAGLVPSLAMLARNFAADGSWLVQVPVNVYVYATLLVSIGACVLVSLATPPIEDEVAASFYAKVRPFGIWRHEAAIALRMNLPHAGALSFPLAVVNVALGVVASFALFMGTVYFFGHWTFETGVCGALFLGCLACLYFTWFKTLPSD